MRQPWQNQDYQFKLPVVMGIIRRSEYVKTLEEAVSYIEYAVSQGYNGRPGASLLGGNHVDLQAQPQRRLAVPELHLNVFVSPGQLP